MGKQALAEMLAQHSQDTLKEATTGQTATRLNRFPMVLQLRGPQERAQVQPGAFPTHPARKTCLEPGAKLKTCQKGGPLRPARIF